VSTNFRVYLVNGWRIERDLTSDERDEAYELSTDNSELIRSNPMSHDGKYFWGKVTAFDTYDGFIVETASFEPNDPLVDPPVAIGEWVRGVWLIGHWS
jgi:hypothetical protein